MKRWLVHCDRCGKELNGGNDLRILRLNQDGYDAERDLCVPCADWILGYIDTKKQDTAA